MSAMPPSSKKGKIAIEVTVANTVAATRGIPPLLPPWGVSRLSLPCDSRPKPQPARAGYCNPPVAKLQPARAGHCNPPVAPLLLEHAGASRGAGSGAGGGSGHRRAGARLPQPEPERELVHDVRPADGGGVVALRERLHPRAEAGELAAGVHHQVDLLADVLAPLLHRKAPLVPLLLLPQLESDVLRDVAPDGQVKVMQLHRPDQLPLLVERRLLAKHLLALLQRRLVVPAGPAGAVAPGPPAEHRQGRVVHPLDLLLQGRGLREAADGGGPAQPGPLRRVRRVLHPGDALRGAEGPRHRGRGGDVLAAHRGVHAAGGAVVGHPPGGPDAVVAGGVVLQVPAAQARALAVVRLPALPRPGPPQPRPAPGGGAEGPFRLHGRHPEARAPRAAEGGAAAPRRRHDGAAAVRGGRTPHGGDGLHGLLREHLGHRGQRADLADERHVGGLQDLHERPPPLDGVDRLAAERGALVRRVEVVVDRVLVDALEERLNVRDVDGPQLRHHAGDVAPAAGARA
mmetsp:Transcript_59301/g.166992  ORF Transcript_59301/g.166992 Transcript_59301/m.166992 type:complete len:514 (-) Transcript_59301:167-1708(-)